MAEASIPVNLFNPGQVFACLGFLEAADVLLGDAEGGFDWSDEALVRFMMRTAGDENPFAVVLKFLAEAEVRRCAPIGYTDLPLKKKALKEDDDDDEEGSPADEDLRLSECFPDPERDPMKLRMKLPIRLEHRNQSFDLCHWADGSRRNDFKLYAGNRSAYGIACAMLRGTRKKPTKKQTVGTLKTKGIASLWNEQQDELTAKPFDVLTLMGGRFNFDAGGGGQRSTQAIRQTSRNTGLRRHRSWKSLRPSAWRMHDPTNTRRGRFATACGLA
jgi:hypothetical protein